MVLLMVQGGQHVCVGVGVGLGLGLGGAGVDVVQGRVIAAASEVLKSSRSGGVRTLRVHMQYSIASVGHFTARRTDHVVEV